jgi:kinesin family protein 6/9
MTQLLNTAHTKIDTLKQQLLEKRKQPHAAVHPHPNQKLKQGTDSGGTDEVVDEEEFLLMRQARDTKRDYRMLHDALTEAKQEVAFLERSLDFTRARLVQEFQAWYHNDDDGLMLSSSHTVDTAAEEEEDDKLDEGEKFDQLELERIRAQDPDSLAFFQAQKKVRNDCRVKRANHKT